MRARPGAASFLVLLGLPIVACGLLPCGDAGVLAELTRSGAGVDRDFDSKVGQWKSAVVGERFRMGDGVRTPAAERAELRLLPSGGVRVEPSTLLRFERTAPGQQPRLLRVEEGEIEVELEGVGIAIETGSGIARVPAGTTVRVGAKGDFLSLRVLVGELFLESPDGSGRTVRAGQEVRVRVGKLALEAAAALTDGAVAAAVADAAVTTLDQDPSSGPNVDAGAAAEAGAPPGGRDPFVDPPALVDLRVRSAESVTVHDPSPPSALAIPVDCAGEAQVELSRRGRPGKWSARRNGEARVRLEAGNYRYRVLCEGAAPVQGFVAVRRDAGTRRLPRTPPRVTVDADGRPYTVRYQNLLPAVTFAWPNAPKSQAYEMRLSSAEGGGKGAVHRGSTPRIALGSGQVDEGTYRFSFSAAGHASKPGTLKVAFDNTARAAYLSSPQDGATAPGATALVSGAALAGSDVSVNGISLAPTRQGRFKSEVVPAADRSAVAVRVSHAVSGVHYYLRHLAR